MTLSVVVRIGIANANSHVFVALLMRRVTKFSSSLRNQKIQNRPDQKFQKPSAENFHKPPTN